MTYTLQAQYTFECNFDDGFCMGSRHCSGGHDCDAQSMPIVPDPGGRPGSSLISKLWKTDERAEVRSNPNYTPPPVNPNSKPEAWYSVKYFFPGFYDWDYGNHKCPHSERGNNRGNQTIICQMNSYPVKNPLPCSGVGSHFKQCRKAIYFEFQRSDGRTGTQCTKHFIGDIFTDQWLSLLIHARWSGDPDGFLHIWYNGNLVFDQSDIRTYWHNEDQAPKPKFGLYYGDPWTGVDAPDEKVIYIDDIRIKDGESSFKDMCPDSVPAESLNPQGSIENQTTTQRFGSIQPAINNAQSGDTIIVEPGVYRESITLRNINLTIQSVDPNDPYYIGGTIIQGNGHVPVLSLYNNTADCHIAGLTLRTGLHGILGSATHATIRKCRMMDNVNHGVQLTQQSRPLLDHCLITANGQTGITMFAVESRRILHCKPVIKNCIIVDNGEAGIVGGEPVIEDSVIQE